MIFTSLQNITLFEKKQHIFLLYFRVYTTSC